MAHLCVCHICDVVAVTQCRYCAGSLCSRCIEPCRFCGRAHCSAECLREHIDLFHGGLDMAQAAVAARAAAAATNAAVVPAAAAAVPVAGDGR